MPKVDLEAIESRANAATPGPWDYWIRILPDMARVLISTHDETKCSGVSPSDANSMMVAKLPMRINSAGTFCHNRDAEFIAHARTDIPALIDRVRELEAIIAATAREHECVALNADYWVEASSVATGKPWQVRLNAKLVSEHDALWEAIDAALKAKEATPPDAADEYLRTAKETTNG